MTTRLSPHFTLEEFAVSGSHPGLVVPVPAIYVKNVRRLVTTVLQPMRDVLGRPVRVTSGYRSARLNRAVGGSKTSQHRRAEAADVTTGREREVFRAMMLRPRPYPTGQVIVYPDRHFLHVALPSPRYPEPTFCLHWPRRGFTYRVLADVGELDRLWPDPATEYAPTDSEGAE